VSNELPILDLLAGPWETKEFPVDLCFIPNERDEQVSDAPTDVVFLCLIMDKTERSSGWLELMRPYTHPRPTKHTSGDRWDVFYAWTTVESGGHVDHIENSGPSEYNTAVVAWRQVPPCTDLLTLATR
jgi:hypothetical protein